MSRGTILCPACGGLLRTPGGAELKEMRRAAATTQAKVAASYGCLPTFVSAVEGGHKTAPASLVQLYVERFAPEEPPWWEPRPWGDGPPDETETYDAFDGVDWAEIFYTARGDTWCWQDSAENVHVSGATHWRPKGPAPGAKP